MQEKLKHLVGKYGAAQVCVWVGIEDTRTLNQWVSRGIPNNKLERVKLKLKEKK